MKKLITLLSLVILTISCSKDDAPAPIVVPIPIATPATFAFNGLFTIDTSFSADNENFLFENNKLFVGNEAGSIHQELSSGSNLSNDAVAFTYNAATKKINFTYLNNLWEASYDPATGRITNGEVRASGNLAVVGNFTGSKYIPTASGKNLFLGYWKGKYGGLSAEPDTYYNLIIEDGFLTVSSASENSLDNSMPNRYGLSLSAPAINDKTISAVFQYIGGSTFSMQATYNPTTKKLEGTWGTGLNTAGGGTVLFESQNAN